MRPTFKKLRIVLKNYAGQFIVSALAVAMVSLIIFLLISVFTKDHMISQWLINLRTNLTMVYSVLVVAGFAAPILAYIYVKHMMASVNIFKELDADQVKMVTMSTLGTLWGALAVLLLSLIFGIGYMILASCAVVLLAWVGLNKVLISYVIL